VCLAGFYRIGQAKSLRTRSVATGIAAQARWPQAARHVLPSILAEPDLPCHTAGMTRRRTTLYLDDELLRAAAERAARSGRQENDIIEEALRRYFGLEAIVRRIQARGDLDEDESVVVAYDELDSLRAERAKQA